MSAWATAAKRAVAAAMSALLAGGTLGLLMSGTAWADSAPAAPSAATPTTVSADALPTVQINGVAWAQVVVGNTVYVAGSFSSARPAGAAAGTQETPRGNLLAYDIRTGQLLTSFAPNLNAQALAVTASPDGSRIYVGGDFTTADGQARGRIAAYSTATGQLISTFHPSVNSQVRAIAATDTTVYFGGMLTAVGSSARNRLAAAQASDGALLPWAPQPGVGSTDGNRLPDVQDANGNPIPNPKNQQTSNVVRALVVAGSGGQVVAAGHFDSLNGVKATGVGALDGVTGATRPFAINQLITNQGVNSAVYSLSTDGTTVYGTGYDYYGPGNLEGSFAATADGGNVLAINDCHGDTYSSFATAGVLYLSTHAHDCGNIGGFPEENPRINKYATAVSVAPVGAVGPNTLENGNFVGQPAPALLPWFPTLTMGTFTGQSQAGWTVSGNSQYVVYGGEFPRVNNTAQQGLVRFAVPSIAPNKVGPNANDDLTPTVVSTSAGTARVSWRATFDNDNENLVYKVIRSDRPTQPVFQATASSTFWNRPTMGFVDRGLTPGKQYTYRVYAYDPFNNSATRATTTVTVSADTSGGGLYSETVLGDNPTNYWRLDGAAGSAANYDQAGFDDLALASGVTQGVAGALAGTSNTAASFDGASDGTAATKSPITGPQAFSLEAWFKTTTTSGGKIVGFGDSPTGNSNSYDRHVYMDDSGRVYFGVWLGYGATVQTGTAYNDGNWHHVVGTVGPTGLAMYMDGKLVGQRSDATGAQSYAGYWRIGGDTGWAGSSPWFNGDIDEVAVYPGPLTAAQVQRHFAVGSTGEPYNEPPTASFTSSANGLTATFDGSASADPDGSIAASNWDFGDGTTGSGASVTHTYGTPGTYRVQLTVTDARGATGTASRAIGIAANGTVGGAYSAAVLDSGAAHYWRFGETTGQASDFAGTSDLAVGSGVTRGTAGAIAGDADTAATFDGSGEGRASTQTAAPGPDVFSIEAWFRTTSTSGGKIVGYGNESSGNSSNYDRHVYMDESGRLYFGVWTGAMSTVQSQPGLNDGKWHYVVGSLSPAGLVLSVDGQQVDSRTDTTAGQPYDGYWRIGGDSSWAGANYFAGDIDDVAIYPAALSADTVSQHYALGTSQPPANAAPTAAFTSSTSDLTATVDGSASSDSDGSVASYAWDFGDGTAGSGATTSHAYTAAGTYTVRLTVTDNGGSTGTVQHDVTVTAPPVNQAPTAAFTTSAADLTLSVDGGASADADGSITSYAWTFGDGTSGTGRTASHTYAAAGSYQVTLTVTDDDGASGATTHSVAVTAPPGPTVLARDAFDRTVSGGLGTANIGGAWTVSYNGARQSVTPGVAVLDLATPASLVGSYLPGVSQTGSDSLASFSLGSAPTGGGVSVYLTGRRVAANQEYRGRVRFLANGAVAVAATRLSGSASEVVIGTEVVVPGLTYTPGTALQVRVRVVGTNPTQVAVTVWRAGTTEPAGPTLTRTDTTASLQAPGGLGVSAYLSGSATSPSAVRFTSYSVTAVG
jgi:PKD repeat protein